MASYDQKTELKTQPALNPSAIASNTTTVGTAVNTLTFEAVTFSIQSGTITDGVYTPVVEDSSDNVTYAPVADDFLIGTEAEAAFVAADDNVCKRIGYVGKKQYARLSIVSTGVTTGGALSAQAILGEPFVGPVA